MFISKAEKNAIQMAIRDLQSRIRDLEIETTWLKNKTTNKRSVVFKTDEAPWGYKLDGSPRKRPGRKIKPMEVSS
jgi:hypothetical protein